LIAAAALELTASGHAFACTHTDKYAHFPIGREPHHRVPDRLRPGGIIAGLDRQSSVDYRTDACRADRERASDDRDSADKSRDRAAD